VHHKCIFYIVKQALAAVLSLAVLKPRVSWSSYLFCCQLIIEFSQDSSCPGWPFCCHWPFCLSVSCHSSLINILIQTVVAKISQLLLSVFANKFFLLFWLFPNPAQGPCGPLTRFLMQPLPCLFAVIIQWYEIIYFPLWSLSCSAPLPTILCAAVPWRLLRTLIRSGFNNFNRFPMFQH